MDELLYRFIDYKAFLKEKISENKGRRGYHTQLALAAGCQKSFLSQVLNYHVHFTPDHAAGVCKFWKFEPPDAAYFLDLVLLARAGSRDLRNLIESRIKQARERHQQVSSRFQNSQQLKEPDLAEYYCTWFYSAVHVLATLPGYNTADAISSRLRLSRESVQQTLQALARMKLLVRQGNTWKAPQHDLFLSKESPFVRSYHSAWRNRAINELQNYEPDALHFTSLYAMSHEDLRLIKDELLEVIARARLRMPESKEEDLACLGIDFFRVH